jgi:L-rhamnose mutarotase
MKKLHFSITINAPRKKEWDTIHEDGWPKALQIFKKLAEEDL